LGEFVSGGVLSLSFSLPFIFVCRFSYHLLVLRFFLLLDDFLELFFGFRSSSCASRGLGFKIQTKPSQLLITNQTKVSQLLITNQTKDQLVSHSWY
jgi:hypothetical protein